MAQTDNAPVSNATAAEIGAKAIELLLKHGCESIEVGDVLDELDYDGAYLKSAADKLRAIAAQEG